MKYTLIINDIDDSDGIVEAVREVAQAIEDGYSGGIVGCSGASWSLDVIEE